MISNIIPCYYCRQCLNTNELFYVEVRNECPPFISMSLKYTIYGKRVKKSSPPFKTGESQHIVFPDGATDINMAVWDCSFNPPALICTRYIPIRTIRRYRVIGPQYGDFQCLEINCI